MAGEGNGNGGEGDKAGGEVQQQLNDAMQKVGGLETETKSLKDAKVDLERKLDDADKELLSEDYLSYKESRSKGGDKGGKGGEGAAGADFDIDNASNAELLKHVGTQTKGDLDKVVKELSSRITKADERVGFALAQVDISLTTMRHPDGGKEPGFSENFDSIKAIAKTNPSWGAEKCYQQFKLEKTQGEKETADAAEKKAEEDRKTRTEKGEGVPGSAATDKELSKDEAADLAYRKAFGNKQTEE